MFFLVLSEGLVRALVSLDSLSKVLERLDRVFVLIIRTRKLEAYIGFEELKGG